MDSYYQDQLNKVKPNTTVYSPTIKVFANGNGEDTKHMALNKESATALIIWLTEHFLK